MEPQFPIVQWSITRLKQIGKTNHTIFPQFTSTTQKKKILKFLENIQRAIILLTRVVRLQNDVR